MAGPLMFSQTKSLTLSQMLWRRLNVNLARCTTISRHDGCLHRGVQLAALPFVVYMARVKRVSRSTRSETNRKYIFSFDPHYPSTVLYCQHISEYMTISRSVQCVRDQSWMIARRSMQINWCCFERTLCRQSVLTLLAKINEKFAAAWHFAVPPGNSTSQNCTSKSKLLKNRAPGNCHYETCTNRQRATLRRFYILPTLRLVKTFM